AETYGWEAYDDYMVHDIMIPYLQSGELFPLADPDELWGYTTYEKGASVLHMLRHILGDEDFYASLESYYDHHDFETATSLDLRDHIELVTGDDIDWFFDTWVFDWGFPIYSIGYSWEQSGSDWDVTITVKQDQWVGPLFVMPLEFLIQGSSEDSLVVMWNDVQSDVEVFTVPFEPLIVRFDPGHFVLSTALLGVEDQPAPPGGGTGLMRVFPNPSSGTAVVEWPGLEGLAIRIGVYDVSGRLLQTASLEPGSRSLSFDGLPAGTYLVEGRSAGNLRQVTRLILL
ncbi:T9SS type A sorting domain-containing protein, partial [Candidatus Fermentibacterales bacterium]|nr:T9SS type A sorting domain-containing protein [Candidatus Fermentibacterales bacterium]